MFNAPEIITNIPDIAQIYAINDGQCDDLELAIETMDQNIFLDTMNEDMIARWESMLGIVPLDDDTVEDRRFRVKSKVMERLPYSIRVIWHKLDTLCPDGYVMILNDDLTEAQIKLALKSKKMIDDVGDLMEDTLPLNIVFVVSIIWNQYETLTRFTHRQLAHRTHRQIREEVFE